MFHAGKDTNDLIQLAFYSSFGYIHYAFFIFVTSFVNNHLNTYYFRQQTIIVTNYCHFVIVSTFVFFEVWVISCQTLINDFVWYLKRNARVYFNFYGFYPSEIFSTQLTYCGLCAVDCPIRRNVYRLIWWEFKKKKKNTERFEFAAFCSNILNDYVLNCK